MCHPSCCGVHVTKGALLIDAAASSKQQLLLPPDQTCCDWPGLVPTACTAAAHCCCLHPNQRATAKMTHAVPLISVRSMTSIHAPGALAMGRL